MMKTLSLFAPVIVLGLTVAGLTGCGDLVKQPEYRVDQTKRIVLFQACLKLLPAGPISTQYNDWSEVVTQCENSAYYQSQECFKNCENSSVK